MSIWILLLITVFLILIYLLVAPFYIEIDSNKGLFRFRFHRLLSMHLTLNESSVYAHMKFGFWQKKFDLLAAGKKPKQKKVNKPKGSVIKKKSFHPIKGLRKMKGIMKSFQLKQCEVAIDTGDNSLNAALYPCFYFLSCKTGRNIAINFQGENTVILQIQNSLNRIVWAFIKS